MWRISRGPPPPPFQGVKGGGGDFPRPGFKADLLTLTNADIKNE